MTTALPAVRMVERHKPRSHMPAAPQPSRRVLLIGDSSLLHKGVASLLMAELNLEVSDIIFTDDMAFVEAVWRLQPEVVVLKETPSLDVARFFRLLRDDLVNLVRRGSSHSNSPVAGTTR